MMKIFARSIALRLNALCAALAATALAAALAGYVSFVIHERQVEEWQRAADAVRLAERANAHVLDVVMESRGIYMAQNRAQVDRFGAGLTRALDRLDTDLAAWAPLVPAAGRTDFAALQQAAGEFKRFRLETLRVGQVEGAPAANVFGNNDTNRANRQALNERLVAAANAASARADALVAEAQTAGRRLAVGVLVATVALVLLLSAVTVLLLRRTVLRPMAAVGSAAQAMSQGQLDTPVSGADRPDEIGQTARALEAFRNASLASRAAEAARAGDAARAVARTAELERRIATFEAEAQSGFAAMEGAAGTLEGAAARLGATAEAGRTRTETAAGAAEETASGVQTVAAATEELVASIAEVTRQMSDAARRARSAETEVQATEAKVRGLSEAAARIGDAVRLIESIAGQTNLLALNATIEAARAGDAGKGFAVVAGEVKALAGQTARATEEIGAQVGAIRSATEGVVSAIAQIATAVNEMGGLTRAVADAAEQQTSATREITRRAADMAGGTQRVTETLGVLAEGAGETDAAGAHVRESATILAERTAALRRQTDDFLAGLRAA